MTLPPVAVIADAHRAEIAADPGADGVVLNGRQVWLRPWDDVVTASRAVNESPALFDAAIERVQARGIRHVVLLGDYTDAGQTGATAALAARLALWRDRAGLVFHALPGNHDMWGVAGKHSAARVLRADGGSVSVSSDPDLPGAGPGRILSPGMRIAGQADALRAMAGFGYMRRPGDLHWESPFGADDRPDARQHVMQARDGSVSHRVLDASYLVEPAAGLWLLMLDANVWEPRPGIADPRRKRAFLDPSDAGWTAVVAQRPRLIDWVAGVAARARAGGKTLLALSHYPLRDPFGAAGTGLGHLGHATLSRRAPDPAVAQVLADAGVTLHLGGHMHVRGESRGGGLRDVAVPSLVAWPPGFAVVHPGDGGRVEQVSLGDVPCDRALMAIYAAQGADGEGAAARTIGDFLLAQARARAIRRHLPRDWPPGAAALLAGSLADLAQGLGLPGDGVLGRVAGRDLAADWHVLRPGATPAEAAIPADRARAYARLSAALTASAPRLPSDLAALARVIGHLSRLTSGLVAPDGAAP
ncbi:MAG: metallophosphoesterase [Paracoccaceae bacterium]|nr:MAG: metallophosphoesterase [Paracoccaceae bacterium]